MKLIGFVTFAAGLRVFGKTPGDFNFVILAENDEVSVIFGRPAAQFATEIAELDLLTSLLERNSEEIKESIESDVSAEARLAVLKELGVVLVEANAESSDVGVIKAVIVFQDIKRDVETTSKEVVQGIIKFLHDMLSLLSKGLPEEAEVVKIFKERVILAHS